MPFEHRLPKQSGTNIATVACLISCENYTSWNKLTGLPLRVRIDVL